MRKIIFLALIVSVFTSCVSRKKYTAMQSQSTEFKTRATNCETELGKIAGDLSSEQAKSKRLEEELDHLKKTNTNLLDRMADLSVISKTEAENIKKSLDHINEQGKQINELSTSIRQKDSLNLALVMNLKRSLADVNDDDVNIEVKKGVVYISLSDKMLFKSGSYKINPAAEVILGKIASVANDHKDLDLLIEGHTDNVPIATDCIEDNWDLSSKRATAVVRLLQKKYNIAPQRLTAGGRSEYATKSTNETAEGRSLNRRTEIIILPKLDQFFQLMDNDNTK
ncbi:MAG: OmpA family protein [Bacteroidota bacterium]